MTRRFPQISARVRIGLLAGGLVLMVVAWIGATVPFFGPDEASHYDRAITLTHGNILGPRSDYLPNPGLDPTQEAFIDHDTRAVWVPAKLMAPDVICIDGKRNVAGCLVATPVGNFAPLGYVLPAVAISASHDTASALWRARAASALQSLAFLLLAVALLWDGSGWSLLGLLAAVSPMALFCFSVVNLSGIEVASCLAFLAAILRVSRDGASAPASVWTAFTFAGVVALLTGPIDLAFAIVDLAALAVLMDREQLRALRHRRAARIAAAVLAPVAVLAFAYTRIAGFDSRFAITPVTSSLHGGLSQLGLVLKDGVGDFASQTVRLPLGVDLAWWLLVAGMIACALALGDRRERIAVAATTTIAIAFPVLFWAWIDRYSGFGLQGREVLPILMAVPLVAGEVIFRHRGALEGRRIPQIALASGLGLIATIQAYAWWLSAGAAAGTPGTIRFYAHATWIPPGGWTPWLTGAVAGTLALLAFALSEALPGPAASDYELAAATIHSVG